MANAITALNPAYWSKRMQIVRFKLPVYRAVANFEERALLKTGDTVHRVYRTGLRVVSYTKGTALTAQDLTATDESLAVNQTKAIMFYIDRVDEIQNDYDTANQFADDAGKLLEQFVDAAFLAQITNASSVVDDGDFGGTAGTSVILSATNVTRLFAAAAKKLNRANIPMQQRYAVIPPSVLQLLVEKLDGKDTALGDTTGMNGMVGKYMGFDLYVSNNLYWTGRWTPANQPTTGATITINGVVFNLVTTIGTTAGNVLVETDTATTLTNLFNFINAPTVTNTKQIALSEASVKALTGITAINGTTYLGITFAGGGEIAVATSEPLDPWSLQTVHCMFGQKGAVDVVVQEDFSVKFKDVPDKNGQNVLAFVLYGMKTFNEGTLMLVDGQVDSSAF